MKDTVKVGMIGEEQFVVSEQHSIDFAYDGMPQILSTPWLIWFLEHAARSALQSAAALGVRHFHPFFMRGYTLESLFQYEIH